MSRWWRGQRGAGGTGRRRQRGSTMVETALVLMVLLLLVFGLLDLGFTVFRYSVVSQGARQTARQAIVRGEMAPPKLSQWGPQSYQATADSGDEIAQAVRPYLSGLDLDRTMIRIEWIDGDSAPESRLRATVTTDHQPMVALLFGNRTWTLSGTSTMKISH